MTDIWRIVRSAWNIRKNVNRIHGRRGWGLGARLRYHENKMLTLVPTAELLAGWVNALLPVALEPNGPVECSQNLA